MKLLVKLAIRNVGRNIKSTLLNGVGISFSVLILLLTLILSKGIETQIMTRNIKFDTGAVQINIFKKTASTQNKEEGDELLRTISGYLDNNKSVTGYESRIYITNSIMYFNDNTQKVHVIGLAKAEIPLLEEMSVITDGNTDFTNSKKIVISNALSELLDIHVGDKCTLMVQSVDGAVNIEDFTVTGLFRSTSLRDKFTVYADYGEAKTLYNTNLPSKIFISVADLEQADAVKGELLDLLGCNTIDREGEVECKGTKISSYTDHMSMAKSLSGINKYGMLMVAVFLVLISFIGVWSMQTENISRRRREIGTLLSFGFSKRSVKAIFILEILYISLLFFLAGFIVTAISVYLINLNNGIFLGESASYAFGSSIVNPVLTVKDLFTVFLIAIIYPLLATIISLRAINKGKTIELLNGGSQ